MSKGKVEEEEIRRVLSEVIEPIAKETYGVGIKEIIDRINKMNMELREVSEAMRSLDKTVATLDERTKGMDKRISDLREDMSGRIGDLREDMSGRISDLANTTKTYFIVLGVIVSIAGILVPILLRLL